MTYLAVSISGKTTNEVRGQISRACEAGAEMLELRLDYLLGLEAETARGLVGEAKGRGLPVIATCRDKKEGGANDYPAKLRCAVLEAAAEAGADYIDCEYANFNNETKQRLCAALKARPGCKLILSAHQFEGRFHDLTVLYDCILAVHDSAIPKLVYTANHINDCFEAFDLLREKETDAIVLCMGKGGMISRILAKKLGGLVSFASVDETAATAPGQVTVEQMKGLFRWDHIDAETELYGLVGCPVGHSMSPANFNACFERLGMNALYLPLLVEGENGQLNEFLNGISIRDRLGFRGLSVTIPHKTAALDYVEHKGEYADPLAVRIGASNTLKVGFGGIITAYNTDYVGAMEALTRAMKIDKHDLHGYRVAVVGAGGAARAVIAGLADVGAHITIYNRTEKKARQLAGEFKCRHERLEKAGELEADIIINCTSIGMHPHTNTSPVPKTALREGMVVFDTVYNPMRTLLLEEAEAAGAMCISGVEMFIHQALAQYRIFTGREPEAGLEDFMREIVVRRLR